MCELFIQRKYASFKEEMMNYKDEFAKDKNERGQSYAKDSEIIQSTMHPFQDRSEKLTNLKYCSQSNNEILNIFG